MAYVPMEEIIKNLGSVYKAVNLASRRAKELIEGSPKLVNVNSPKISTIALEEIRQGKVSYRKVKKEGR